MRGHLCSGWLFDEWDALQDHVHPPNDPHTPQPHVSIQMGGGHARREYECEKEAGHLTLKQLRAVIIIIIIIMKNKTKKREIYLQDVQCIVGDLARKSDPCTMSHMDLVEEVSLVCILAQTSMPVVQPSMVGVGTEGQTVQTRPAVRRKAPPETPQHPVGHVRFPKNQKWVQASCLPQVSVVFPLTQSVVVPTAKTLARLKTTFYSSGYLVMAEWRQTGFSGGC